MREVHGLLGVVPPREHVSAVQVCNHRFHNMCLQRWADTSCPVCRYVANSEASSSHCETCSSSQACSLVSEEICDASLLV